MRSTALRATLYAVTGALAAVLLIGLPTALVPNPIFGRMIPPDTLDYAVFAVTVALAGALAATYAWPSACPLPERRLAAGTIVTYLAVGCPTCNKLVLLALGTSGALQWFAPLQPFFGVAGIALLGWSVLSRLRTLRSAAGRASPRRLDAPS
ncbi:MAG: hypothetical protein RMK01_08215 [Thermomicrobium sp.]|nr:hypothetical protein [Thermomicrobium sp.]MDW8060043.1 hypothetical protein [Thermomicrobium sp.]